MYLQKPFGCELCEYGTLKIIDSSKFYRIFIYWNAWRQRKYHNIMYFYSTAWLFYYRNICFIVLPSVLAQTFEHAFINCRWNNESIEHRISTGFTIVKKGGGGETRRLTVCDNCHLSYIHSITMFNNWVIDFYDLLSWLHTFVI